MSSSATHTQDIVTPYEAAQILGLNKNRIYKWLQLGKIPVARRERRSRFGPDTRLVDLADIEAQLALHNPLWKREEILRLHMAGRSIADIARDFNIKPDSVRRSLQRSGVKSVRRKAS